MKKIALIAFLALSLSINLFAQNKSDEVRRLFGENEYEQAAALIPDALKENPKDAQFLSLCGDIYFELERYNEALDAYTKSEDRERNPQIMRKVGRTMSYLSKHKEAIEFLKETASRDKKDVYSVLELAYAYIKADSLSQAELLVTRAREMNKSIPDAFIALGDLYFAQKVYELAKDNYEEALSLDPKLLDARTKLAISYYWLANKEPDRDLANELFARSLKEWNTITQQDAKNARAWFEQGKILFFSQKHELASQSLYQYVQLRPNGHLGRWYLSQSLFKLGACDSAAPQLEIVAENVDSVKTKAKLMLAECYFTNKNYQGAVTLYSKLMQENPLGILDMKRLAASFLNTSDTANFIQTYVQTIEQYPNESCKDMYSFGKTLIKLKDYTKAIYLFEKKLSNSSCQSDIEPDLKYWLGIGYFFNEADTAKTARLQKARQFFDESIKADSSNYSAYVYLGDVLAALGDTKSTETIFNTVIEKAKSDTTSPEKKNALNQAFAKYCGMKLESKKYQDIVKIGTDWAKYFSDSPFPYLYIAIGYQGQGDKDNACKFYRRVLQVDPKNTTAKKYIGDLGCS